MRHLATEKQHPNIEGKYKLKGLSALYQQTSIIDGWWLLCFLTQYKVEDCQGIGKSWRG
jgi:hypothetical protein